MFSKMLKRKKFIFVFDFELIHKKLRRRYSGIRNKVIEDLITDILAYCGYMVDTDKYNQIQFNNYIKEHRINVDALRLEYYFPLVNCIGDPKLYNQMYCTVKLDATNTIVTFEYQKGS